MAVYQIDDETPQVHPTAWVADNASVIGRVSLAQDSSVWYGCVLRGDNEWITVGRGTNIQENSVLHTDMGSPLTLGEDVTVGHSVTLHGCTVGDGSLIGIGAIVLNGARIGKGCIVGAHALVTEGKEFPDGSLIVGSPAKAVREVSAEQIAKVRGGALHYVENAQVQRTRVKRIA